MVAMAAYLPLLLLLLPSKKKMLLLLPTWDY
jgi:hypothetical protein